MLTRNLLAIALSTAACGGVTDPGEDMQMHEDDTTAPTVVSTLPADKAVGVAAGDKIVITFSEPMDGGKVYASYGSEQLLIDETSWSWNEDLTVLTISADAGLKYVDGVGHWPYEVVPLTYKISIGGGSTDLAGNALGTDYEFSFATKKRLHTSFTLDPALTRVKVGGSFLGSSNDIWVGDNAVKSQYSAFLTFDIAQLPDDIVIEHAEFSARQMAPQGYPYGQLGPVQTHHVSFPDMNNLSVLQAISLPGMFSQDDGMTKTIDVTSQVADDYANRIARGGRTQYRLQMDTATNNDDVVDKAIFSLATFSMAVILIAD
jgi:hypothetical protein